MATSTQRPHALIIEDELLIGLGLQHQLAELGYRSFAFAGTELQAISQAELKCPDLVTVDVGLLDGSGLDAVETILRACGPLPVIYITGDAGALRGRPDAVVLEKPVGQGALAAAVARARRNPARAQALPRRPGESPRATVI